MLVWELFAALQVYTDMDSTLDFSSRDLDRIIEMAWEDRTPFGAIEHQFGLSEREVIRLMRRELKSSSFRRWRSRVSGRKTKHRMLRSDAVNRHAANRQRHISLNKISKR